MFHHSCRAVFAAVWFAVGLISTSVSAQETAAEKAEADRVFAALKMIIDEEKLIVGGDIILAINGVKFENSDEALLNISKTIERKDDGSTPVKLTVLRGGKIIELGRN